jgi:hypothetical protein
MRSNTRKEIRSHFQQVSTPVFWPSDLSNFVNERRREWDESDLGVQQVVRFLLKEGVLRKAEFRSREYSPIIRYLRGNPSPYELAVSLRRDSFVCHRTALTLHDLEPPTTTIYVNKEQGPKPTPEGLTQEGINRAFKNEQRQSNYIFRYEGWKFVLISGKNTGEAGVILMRAPDGAAVNATDLERTLIDIVVRPAYAGGLKRVLSVYKRAVPRIDVEHMISLIHKLDYAYPYHQSIGFLLQHAGRPERDCEKFKDFGLDFDFFLDYGLERPAYDRNWRLYYPPRMA